jgi:hypothetical protein
MLLCIFSVFFERFSWTHIKNPTLLDMTALSFNVMPCLLMADPHKILNLEKISHKNKQTKKISSNAGFFICAHEIKKSFKSLE